MNSFFFYDPAIPPVRIILRKKLKRRKLIIKNSNNVWEYFRKSNIIAVIPYGKEFRFYTKDKQTLKPIEFFSLLKKPIIELQRENRTIELRPVRQTGYIADINRQTKWENKSVVVDRSKEQELVSQLNIIADYYASWLKMTDSLLVGTLEIPHDLQFNKDKTWSQERQNKKTVLNKKKKWTTSKSAFAQFVIESYKEDEKRKSNKRLFKDKKDASNKLFQKYEFPKEWKWSESRCYQNVVKVK